MGRRAGCVLLLFLCCVLFFGFPVESSAAESPHRFEFALGPGISLSNLDSRQLLLAPAVSIPVKGTGFLRFRIEGNAEFIDFHDKFNAVLGVAPFFRTILPKGRVRPFAEIGGGINYSTHTYLDGDRLKGPFLFSAMANAGLEFTFQGRPASLSYRVRHLSNGHLYHCNKGINSQYLMMSVSF